MEGVLFANRVSKHSSTKYSPFKLLYNREPVLPIDVKCRLSSTEISKCDEPFDKDIFDVVWPLVTSIEKRYINRLVKI